MSASPSDSEIPTESITGLIGHTREFTSMLRKEAAMPTATVQDLRDIVEAACNQMELMAELLERQLNLAKKA
jgi:hypothetical protein